MSYSKISSLSVLCVLGAIGCGKNEPEPMTPAAGSTPPESYYVEQAPAPAPQAQPQTQAPPAAGPTGQSATADSDRSSKLIANARCEREVLCNNVGGEGKYVTQEDCVVSLEPATRSELDARNCPKGTSEVELKECTDEIKEVGCDQAIPSIETISECSNDEICAD